MSGLLAASSVPEQVSFWILAIVSVLGALAMVGSRKAVHSALWLALVMIALAFLYILQGAVFLGIVQIVVYTGAVMMLFLFVLMVVGVDSSDSLVETLPHQRFAAIVTGIGFGLLLIIGLGRASLGTAVRARRGELRAGQQRAGHRRADLQPLRLGLRDHVGAADRCRGGSHGACPPRARSCPGSASASSPSCACASSRPTSLPTPGVYARHNAVDTPALLPDGSPSPESVPGILPARPGRRPCPRRACSTHRRRPRSSCASRVEDVEGGEHS